MLVPEFPQSRAELALTYRRTRTSQDSRSLSRVRPHAEVSSDVGAYNAKVVGHWHVPPNLHHMRGGVVTKCSSVALMRSYWYFSRQVGTLVRGASKPRFRLADRDVRMMDVRFRLSRLPLVMAAPCPHVMRTLRYALIRPAVPRTNRELG